MSIRVTKTLAPKPRSHTLLRLLPLVALALAGNASAQIATGGITMWGVLGARESAASSARVKQVCPFQYNVLALRSDGTYVEWGAGWQGQHNFPAGNPRFTQVAASSDNGSYAMEAGLQTDGTVKVWGSDPNGWFTGLDTVTGATQIALGSYHLLALKSDGTVVARGYNGSGQCNVPADLTGVKQVAAGFQHSMALKSNGTVVCWGYNGYGQCNVPAGLTGVKQIATYWQTSYALKKDGTVVVWGDNNEGEFNIPAGLNHVVQIAAGYHFAIALKDDGTVVPFGWGGYGLMSPPAGLTDVVSVSAGAYNLTATKADGSVVVWGRNDECQCLVPQFQTTRSFGIGGDGGGHRYFLAFRGDGSYYGFGTNYNGQLNFASGISPTQLSAGYYHALCVNSDGTVSGWGSNDYGDLNIPAISNAKQVSAGYINSMILGNDGTVSAFGYDGYGAVTALNGVTNGKQVLTTVYNGFVLKNDGTVAAAGYDGYGQVTGALAQTDLVEIAAGHYYFGLGRKSDGSVVGWGYNGDGELNVPAVTDAVSIAAGENHGMLLRATGDVLAWGSGNYGANAVPAGLPPTGQISAYGHTSGTLAGVNIWTDKAFVSSGVSATGTITLGSAAPDGGVDVALTTSTPALAVPGTVHVEGGSTSATFSITASNVGADTLGIITASTGIYTNSAVVTVVRPVPALASVKLDGAGVIGGSSQLFRGTVTLSGAVASDTSISLGGLTAGVSSAPSTVIVHAGEKSASFTVSHYVVPAATSQTLVAQVGSSTKSASFTVSPLLVKSLTIAPQSITGGFTAKGTIQLDGAGGAATTVSLASNDAAVQVPATVDVPGYGASIQFTVNSTPVSAPHIVTITATYNGQHVTATVTVVAPKVVGVHIGNPLYGKMESTCTVTLSGNAPTGGSVVTLSSNKTALAVPASVTVLEGTKTATFTVNTTDVSAAVDCILTANYNNKVAAATTVKPNIVASLKLPASITGGSTGTGTVTLMAAVSADVTVTLTTSSPASVPATVTIPAGQKSATFTITTTAVTTDTPVTVTAKRLGVSVTATTTVKH